MFALAAKYSIPVATLARRYSYRDLFFESVFFILESSIERKQSLEVNKALQEQEEKSEEKDSVSSEILQFRNESRKMLHQYIGG